MDGSTAPAALTTTQIGTLQTPTVAGLVRAALVRGLAGQMAPGLAAAAQAIALARTEGLTVSLTISFRPNGTIDFDEPVVVRP